MDQEKECQESYKICVITSMEKESKVDVSKHQTIC